MVAHGGMEESMEGMEGMSGMSGMSGMGMQMAFFTSTDTPLYSEGWTPRSAGAYAGTCIFLIVLAVLLRAVFVAKAYVDAKALESALKRRYVFVEGESATEKMASDASSMTGILTTNGVAENVKIVTAPVKHIQPWRFSTDIPRAFIMTIAAAIGYLLMLAVMTYNIGYFLSVLGGAFLGELAFGRFTSGGMSM